MMSPPKPDHVAITASARALDHGAAGSVLGLAPAVAAQMTPPAVSVHRS